jgi:threonine/homoserine/homoserine lactone efflux protein
MTRTVSHVAHVLPAFLLACVVLAALPGPATALFLHRTIRDGRPAGVAAVAGNELGLFCWTVAGGAGLSALLVANTVLFDAMHVIGAGVLIALGIQALRGSDAEPATAAPSIVPARGRGPRAAFRASLLSIAANPKAAVFAISFFPQFLPRHGPLLGIVLALAAIQVMLDTVWCLGIVLLADRARPLLQRVAIRRRIERMLGAVLVALGIELGIDTR